MNARVWVGALLVVGATACSSGGDASVPDQPGVAPTSAAVKAPEGSITKNGTLIVGTEVKPGAYRAVVPASSLICYYARLASLDESDIVLGGNGTGVAGDTMTVTIRTTDKAFKTNGCGMWVPVT